jgi:hypothetical protein
VIAAHPGFTALTFSHLSLTVEIGVPLSLAADAMGPGGHEANGFGRHYLHEWEARAL